MTWTPQIADLLAPLEDYTRLHAATLRRFGSRAIDLAFPNPRFLSDPRPYRALAGIAAKSGPAELRYSPFGGFTPVRRRLAADLSRQHHLPYHWTDIVATPGAAAALSVVLQTLFAPPDRVMIVRPCWMDYPLYLAQLGLGCDLVSSADDKHLDLGVIERSWTPRTRGIIISQPASPTGVVYSATELAALAAVLSRLSSRSGQPPILIADEAHRGQVWADVACPAPASAYPCTITVHSLSKGWDMQGQRIGYLAVSPHDDLEPGVARQLEQGMRVSGHCAPTSLMQHLAAALADLTPDNSELAGLQRHARQELLNLGVHVLDAQATRFLYLRCPSAGDLAFVAELAERGVLTMPSTLFHENGWFRLALNVPGPQLNVALRVIGEVSAAHA
ncbi:MAG TPA: aminotransferase class I/II-fold pyridoxal phosphate-dependent enzyme [Streptosporangiaceae bacterium]|nr:aminotransferase class I/II-fold pyridoxal phosphate-dependent enzyme [Streptosporangiaceae bacterium]